MQREKSEKDSMNQMYSHLWSSDGVDMETATKELYEDLNEKWSA